MTLPETLSSPQNYSPGIPPGVRPSAVSFYRLRGGGSPLRGLPRSPRLGGRPQAQANKKDDAAVLHAYRLSSTILGTTDNCSENKV